MPKDEFDSDDPLELNGVALFTDEDTTGPMAECFVEEFLRLGYNHKQVLALFRNPHYLGPNLVLQSRGEPFVRDTIAVVFARWGRAVEWRPGNAPVAGPPEITPPPATADPADRLQACPTLTDPMGNPIPELK